MRALRGANAGLLAEQAVISRARADSEAAREVRMEQAERNRREQEEQAAGASRQDRSFLVNSHAFY